MPSDFVTVGIGVTAGLAVFLFGVGLLADNLKAVAGERLARLIARVTSNRLTAVLAGAVVTALLDSSSAVGIITVGLVHARVMTFPQALGVVMGANIGTTLSSQIYALDAVKYGPALLLPGLLLQALGRSEPWRQVGGAVFGLGLVFFGLTTIEAATHPLRDYGPFTAAMTRMENPLVGVLVGAGATAVIQSSSALVGILIVLVGQGAVTMPAAVALMLGAEIGTTLDVLVASAGRTRESLRVGVFQLLFNVASVLLVVGFTVQLTAAAGYLAGDDPKRQLATAHVLFNLASVAVFLPFTGTLARLVERLVPERPKPEAG